MSDLKEIKIVITCLDGTKKNYNMMPLKRKEAVQVFHRVLQNVLGVLAQAGQSDGATMTDLFSALKTIEFEDFWWMAEKILKFVVVDNQEIRDINDTDYFVDNIDELYLAVFHGILENYPKVFFQFKGLLNGLQLRKVMTDSTL